MPRPFKIVLVLALIAIGAGIVWLSRENARAESRRAALDVPVVDAGSGLDDDEYLKRYDDISKKHALEIQGFMTGQQERIYVGKLKDFAETLKKNGPHPGSKLFSRWVQKNKALDLALQLPQDKNEFLTYDPNAEAFKFWPTN